MADEYISREAALNAVYEPGTDYCINTETMDALISVPLVEQRIIAIPAADVRPVVLCKHCRWAAFTPYGTAYGCRRLSTKPNYLLGIPEDFFCAYGDDMREVE